MNVAIDARWILPEISGIGAYTRELVRSLAARDPTTRYTLLFCDPSVQTQTWAYAGLDAHPNFFPLHVPYDVFALAGQARLPALLRHHAIDVFHSPNYMIPLHAFPRNRPGQVRCVTTIHDVIPMVLREHAPRSRKARLYPLYRWIMVQVGARSDAIITDSRASCNDVIHQLRIPEADAAKVHPVYCGVSDRFRRLDRAARPAAPDAPRTLLFVGRTDPYKNLPLLVRALARVRRTCPFPVRLQVIGAPDPRYPEARATAASLGLSDAVHWAGYLPEEDLLEAFRTADLLVHPSRYEGFGLQVAEAMAAGLPVVCSRAGSLPEVAGEAALLVDPDDEEGFAAQIVTVLTDPDTAGRLAERGRQQAARFTWDRTAGETRQVYEAVSAA